MTTHHERGFFQPHEEAEEGEDLDEDQAAADAEAFEQVGARGFVAQNEELAQGPYGTDGAMMRMMDLVGLWRTMRPRMTMTTRQDFTARVSGCLAALLHGYLLC